MLIIILAAVAVATFFYYFIIKPMNYFNYRGITQGNPRWIFGDTFGTVFHTQTWTDMMQNIYYQSPGTRYTGMYFFHFPILMIKDPDLLKQVAVKDFDHFTDHLTTLPADADPLFSKNLFSLKGQKWREMRALLSPSFTSSKMRLMFGLMKESAENFIGYFLEKDDKIIEVDIKDIFSRFSSDIIATTACGIQVNSLKDLNNEIYLMGRKSIDFSNMWKMIKLVLYMAVPPTAKVLNINVFDSDVTDFFQNLIDTTIKAREEKGIVRPDMIHLLMETRKHVDKPEEIKEADLTAENTIGKAARALSNEDIAAQALIFFVAGFDSVSSLMCFAAYELALNQDVQERLREEVRSTWKTCEGKLTYEALLKMKYFDMVLSETLRKWPANVAVDRLCTKPYTIEPSLPGETPVHLQEKDGLWIPIFSIHRDPDNYPDPERFDPERFSDENIGDIKPYTYLPFGLGPRSCIGSRFALLETKVVLFFILLHFELVPIGKTSIPLKLSKRSFGLNAEGKFWLGLRKTKHEEE